MGASAGMLTSRVTVGLPNNANDHSAPLVDRRPIDHSNSSTVMSSLGESSRQQPLEPRVAEHKHVEFAG